MIAWCCVCGEEINLPIEEFLKEENEIDDYFCDECAEEAKEFVIKLKLSQN